MVIIKLKGGLGNQMFQYAFGRSISMRLGESVKLDVSGYYQKNYMAIQDDTTRQFLLDKFKINAQIATPAEISKYNPNWKKLAKKIRGKIFGHENSYVFYSKYFSSKNSYLEGFWNTERYFSDRADVAKAIHDELQLKNPLKDSAQKTLSLIEMLKKNGHKPTSLHVRRSDYVSKKVNADFFGTCDIDYYARAFEEIKKRTGDTSESIELFVFSDDITWAKTNLTFPCPMHFVSCPEIADHEEITLMSSCTHHIIANSSFSWWGAWLDPHPDKIVITPKKWIADPKTPTPDIIPTSWIQV